VPVVSTERLSQLVHSLVGVQPHGRAMLRCVTILMLLPTAISLLLYVTVLAGFWASLRVRLPRLDVRRRAPRVSILKPLAGEDDELANNLASFASLDYPSYEILLGVAALDDPALPIAREFVQAHPGLAARVLLTDPDSALNPKVAQLIALEKAAGGDILVISDSNVRVPADYLRDLVARLEQPAVGLVSNVVVGVGERTLAAAVENLQLATGVAATVVASATFLGKAITVGKSMAMWRSALSDLGGFRVVSDVLAEDYVLGEEFARAGYRVEVSTAPVYNYNSACSIERTLERHTRWAKLRRSVSPLTFALEPVLLPVVVALACLSLLPNRWTALALGVTTLVEVAGAAMVLRLHRGAWPTWSMAVLELVRSAVVFLCWCRACVSRRVAWRGHALELGPRSVVVPVPARTLDVRELPDLPPCLSSLSSPIYTS
jgi:ceramide glucosyltransferase